MRGDTPTGSAAGNTPKEEAIRSEGVLFKECAAVQVVVEWRDGTAAAQGSDENAQALLTGLDFGTILQSSIAWKVNLEDQAN